MHGFGFQIDLKLTKFNGSSFFVKSQSAVLNFCHLTSSFISIYCKMRKKKFCQIIMGSPLNSNVPDGRSVWSIHKGENFFNESCILIKIIKGLFYFLYTIGEVETKNAHYEI